jgi:hypothetical protein
MSCKANPANVREKYEHKEKIRPLSKQKIEIKETETSIFYRVGSLLKRR